MCTFTRQLWLVFLFVFTCYFFNCFLFTCYFHLVCRQAGPRQATDVWWVWLSVPYLLSKSPTGQDPWGRGMVTSQSATFKEHHWSGTHKDITLRKLDISTCAYNNNKHWHTILQLVQAQLFFVFLGTAPCARMIRLRWVGVSLVPVTCRIWAVTSNLCNRCGGLQMLNNMQGPGYGKLAAPPLGPTGLIVGQGACPLREIFRFRLTSAFSCTFRSCLVHFMNVFLFNSLFLL